MRKKDIDKSLDIALGYLRSACKEYQDVVTDLDKIDDVVGYRDKISEAFDEFIYSSIKKELAIKWTQDESGANQCRRCNYDLEIDMYDVDV